MALTPQQMDKKMDEHFAFEGRDDIEGVLATLTDDVEHDIVGWPFGPSQGRDGARKFYETMFLDLSDSKVRCVKRLYGQNFMVDEFDLERAGRRASRSDWRAAIARSNSGCSTSSSLPTAATSSARTCGSISLPSCNIYRRTDVTGTERMARSNQKTRTRKDLLQAASRLMKQGRTPTLEEVAEEALVSRATAYRYFPSVEALMVEAAVDVAVPEPVSFFHDDASRDPVERLQRVETALYDMILANEPLLRSMLAHTIQRGIQADENGKLPRRQNRRTPLIEAALEPARNQFKPADLKVLMRALALIMGPEATIVVKDVLQLDDADARKMKRWAIRALVEAARKPAAHD